MNVQLIDVDLKYRTRKPLKIFPNLALMKISAYHKHLGDNVGFNINNPDKTYISCVFAKNRLFALSEWCNCENNRDFGGSGLPNGNLPDYIEYIKPDYNLYPSTYSMGFTTRGCIRACTFCIVHEKEGRFRKNQHISEFHDFKFKSCKLLDNNILAGVDWFFENTNWAIENRVKLDITQGMDIRLLTPEIVRQLTKIKFVNQQMRFAWDSMETESDIITGISLLKDAGINTRRNVSFYVLCGFNTTFDQDQYRCEKLKQLGVQSFVMKYHNNDVRLNHLARWANRRKLYQSGTSAEYIKAKLGDI